MMRLVVRFKCDKKASITRSSTEKKWKKTGWGGGHEIGVVPEKGAVLFCHLVPRFRLIVPPVFLM